MVIKIYAIYIFMTCADSYFLSENLNQVSKEAFKLLSLTIIPDIRKSVESVCVQSIESVIRERYL